MEVSFEHKDKTHKILIDEEDYDKIKDLKLTIELDNRYKQSINGNGKRLHRYIVNTKSNQLCIHKNNNRFDFRKNNLFVTTKKELSDLVRKGEIQQRFDELDRIYYEF